MKALCLLLLFTGLTLHAAPRRPKLRTGPVSTATDARAIAEQDTGGRAVSARRIHLNGASCGWEVEVHMPTEARGWRCVVDCDTRAVFTKTRIPNPPPPKRKS